MTTRPGDPHQPPDRSKTPIVSLTVALVAVLIPFLSMGNIVGRLIRKFAVSLSVAILVSAVDSLTLSSLMCPKFPRTGHKAPRTRF